MQGPRAEMGDGGEEAAPTSDSFMEPGLLSCEHPGGRDDLAAHGARDGGGVHASERLERGQHESLALRGLAEEARVVEQREDREAHLRV